MIKSPIGHSRSHWKSNLSSKHTANVDLWGCCQTQGHEQACDSVKKKHGTGDIWPCTVCLPRLLSADDQFLSILGKCIMWLSDTALSRRQKNHIKVKSTDNQKGTFWTMLLIFCTFTLYPVKKKFFFHPTRDWQRGVKGREAKEMKNLQTGWADPEQLNVLKIYTFQEEF